MRYFEIAMAEGEGTLTQHQVFACDCGGHLVCSEANTQILCEQIDEARYNEFLAIHGGAIAVG